MSREFSIRIDPVIARYGDKISRGKMTYKEGEKLLKNESNSKSHKSISKTPRRKSITENNSWGLGYISKIWSGGNYKKSNKKSNKKKTHKKTNKKTNKK